MSLNTSISTNSTTESEDSNATHIAAIDQEDCDEEDPFDTDDSLPPLQIVRSQVGWSRRTQQLDEIIRRNSIFLRNHPTPPKPAGIRVQPRKSMRIKKEPERYQGQ